MKEEPKTGASVLYIVILALITAIVLHMLMIRRAWAQSVGFIPSGTWITTENGEKVCQLTQTVAIGSYLSSGFCMNWQTPFFPMMRGQQWPTVQGWVRWSQPWPASNNHLQFHTEQGWKP